VFEIGLHRPDMLLQERQETRMIPLDVRMRRALVPLARGDEYSDSRLMGGHYIYELPNYRFTGAKTKRKIVHDPLYRIVNRPMAVEPTPMYRLSAAGIEDTLQAGRGEPLNSVFDEAVVAESPMTVAKRMAAGETLWQTHVNLESKYSETSDYLKGFTGNVWRQHSTADALKVARCTDLVPVRDMALAPRAGGLARIPEGLPGRPLARPFNIGRGVNYKGIMLGALVAVVAIAAASMVHPRDEKAEAGRRMHESAVGGAYAHDPDNDATLGERNEAQRSDHGSHIDLRIRDAAVNRRAFDWAAAAACSW
jgi:hypothetical protein